jgi:hypothetical protein
MDWKEKEEEEEEEELVRRRRRRSAAGHVESNAAGAEEEGRGSGAEWGGVDQSPCICASVHLQCVTGRQLRHARTSEGQGLEVHAEHFLAALDVRLANLHLAVEAARAQECGIQYVCSVSASQHHDA